MNFVEWNQKNGSPANWYGTPLSRGVIRKRDDAKSDQRRTLIRGAICILVAVLVAGCANDNYAVTPGSTADPASMNATLKICKKEATDKFISENQYHVTLIGALGGAVGGAIGGAIAGAASADADPPNKMKASDIDPYIERCMATKGYTGTSEN